MWTVKAANGLYLHSYKGDLLTITGNPDRSFAIHDERRADTLARLLSELYPAMEFSVAFRKVTA